MPERIYLPSSGIAPVTPSTWNHAYQAGTTYTLPGIRSHLRSNTALTSRTTAGGTTSGRAYGVMRYVFGPVQAVQISGTLNVVMRASESNAAANATMSCALKIIQPGGSDRAVLIAQTASDSATTPYEFTTTLSSRRFYDVSENRPVTMTAQTPTAGDYLVLEIGFRYGSTTSYNIVLAHGDPINTAQLPNSDGDTNAYIPWAEFSNAIPWLETPLPNVVVPQFVI